MKDAVHLAITVILSLIAALAVFVISLVITAGTQGEMIDAIVALFTLERAGGPTAILVLCLGFLRHQATRTA